ncbi:MAG: restriction endonuclease subunit S [Patescibacteria group bacterium]|jgi:type I restriction enzyme S subunit
MLNKWSRLRIEELCECLDNRRIPIAKDKREAGSVPYYGATGIVDYVKNSIFDERLLLVGEDGADWSANANTSYIIDGKSWVNNHAHVLKCTKINEIYLNAYLNFADLTNYINGTTRGKLTKNDLLNINVPVPSVPVQQKIASILSTVDEAIQKTDRIIEKTGKLRDGLMNKLLTKGIGHTKFIKTKLGEIPEEWEIKRLSDVCELIQDGTHFSPKSKEGKYMYITSKNIKEGNLTLHNVTYISEEEHLPIYKRCPVKKGDVLLTKDGANTGNLCVNPLDQEFSLLSSVAMIRGNQTILNDFIYFYMSSDRFHKLIRDSMKGLAITRITLDVIRNFNIAVPPLSEQARLVKILSKMFKKVELYKKEKLSLNNLKNGLINDIFGQKVEVDDVA